MVRTNLSFLFLTLFIGLMVIISANCAVEEDGIPVIDSISPDSKVSYLPSFTLTVDGSGFMEDSVIIFNGLEKTTAYISSERLTCRIDTIDFTPNTAAGPPGNAAVKSESTIVPVLVHNPTGKTEDTENTEEGVDSNIVDFVIYSNHSFSTPVSIDSRSAEFQAPAIAVDDPGNISVVYKFTDNSSGVQAIDYVRSTDNGDTWDTRVRLVETQYGCNNPAVALDSEGYINVVFSGLGIVYFLRSTDGGTSWTAPVQLSDQSDEPLEPAIAVNADNAIFITWPQEDFNSNYPLYFARSANNGLAWDAGQNIFAGWRNAIDAYTPSITTDDDTGVYVTWTFTDGSGKHYCYLNYSWDSGTAWNTTDTDFGECSCSDIAAASNGDIYVVLASTQSEDNHHVVLRKTTDNGASWSDGIDIASDLSNPVPQLGVDSAGNINVIYFDEGFLFSRSIDNGAAWSSGIQVTDENAGDMDMTVDQWGNIYFIYIDENSGEIHFVRSN